MSEQRILIVEDEQMIAELERDYLEANGFTADIASDGTEGMKKVMSFLIHTGSYMSLCALRTMRR